jgi:hypothetical protein
VSFSASAGIRRVLSAPVSAAFRLPTEGHEVIDVP